MSTLHQDQFVLSAVLLCNSDFSGGDCLSVIHAAKNNNLLILL